MRNVKTREGFEYWDKICSLKHYGFLHSPDGKRVVKTEGIGNWIDKFEAQEIVDQAQDEINQYRAERDALQKRLTTADERADVLEGALRTSLLAMKRIYQAGYDRIVEAGGTCDTPEYMMAQDPTTRDLRALLVAKPETVAGHHPACRAVDDYKPGDCSHNCKPAAQPKGEPVACAHDWLDGGE